MSEPAVLVLSLVFPPDSVSTAQIMGELSVALRERGCAVTVLTTTPHYNVDRVLLEEQPLRRWWGPLVQRSEFRGIPVYHALMPRKSGSVSARIAAWLGFHVLSLLVGFLAPLRWSVVLAPSPPLTVGVCAWLLTLRRPSRFVYNVQEIYPDIAISLGALRSPLLVRLLQGLERFVYGRAAAVAVIASRMRERLLAKGVAPPKVVVIPNCTDAATLHPLAKDNAFARQHLLSGRFVVSYAGNMGPAQGLERLLDAARLVQDDPAIVFLLVGDGLVKPALAERVGREGLSNVRLLDQQPYARMSEIYSASDVSVVAQASASGSDAVPSKVYRIMTCARPVLGDHRRRLGPRRPGPRGAGGLGDVARGRAGAGRGHPGRAVRSRGVREARPCRASSTCSPDTRSTRWRTPTWDCCATSREERKCDDPKGARDRRRGLHRVDRRARAAAGGRRAGRCGQLLLGAPGEPRRPPGHAPRGRRARPAGRR